MGQHDDKKKCSYCSGSGQISVIQDGKEKKETCPHCSGTGKA